MSTPIKRLEIIKNAIELEDDDIIQSQLTRLKNEAFDDELQAIVVALEEKNYTAAMAAITAWLQGQRAVTPWRDPQVAASKLELKALEERLRDLIDRRNARVQQLDEFNDLYFSRLGPLMQQILALRKTLAELTQRFGQELPRTAQAAAASRGATRFVAALLFVAAAVAIVWWNIDPHKALWITVSVLVVTCPCALSLATPVTLTVASGALARAGLLVTRGHAIEALARANHFVFDKTGTLTTGRMRLLQSLPLGAMDAQACIDLAATLEQSSEHPLARSLRDAASAPVAGIAEVRSVPGCGIRGQLNGRELRVGRPEWVAELHGRPLGESGAALLAL